VTSDVSEAGYPFGYVVCTCVLNLMSAWVPSVFSSILSRMTATTRI
jgi:hypothetical protein